MEERKRLAAGTRFYPRGRRFGSFAKIVDTRTVYVAVVAGAVDDAEDLETYDNPVRAYREGGDERSTGLFAFEDIVLVKVARGAKVCMRCEYRAPAAGLAICSICAGPEPFTVTQDERPRPARYNVPGAPMPPSSLPVATTEPGLDASEFLPVDMAMGGAAGEPEAEYSCTGCRRSVPRAKAYADANGVAWCRNCAVVVSALRGGVK